jgi:hypothetical protein
VSRSNPTGLTRELLASPAWRSMGIHHRRIIDFLLAEHMRQGCRRNGLLKAPWRQLCAFGIGRRFIGEALVALEDAGLVVCERPGQRSATNYRLTWLPTHDRRPATNEWRSVRAAKLPAKEQAVRSRKRVSNLVHTGVPDGSPNLVTFPLPENLVTHGERLTLTSSKKEGPLKKGSFRPPLPCRLGTPLF